MTYINDVSLLCDILQKANSQFELQEDNQFIPVFSFEGLPGAGKTTQIARVAEFFSQRFGKASYIDIPTSSGIGQILKLLYSDPIKWAELSRTVPWFNPIFVSLDLQLSLIKAKKDGAKYALMSRGILSTYYYNLNAFQDSTVSFTEAWENLSCLLQGFIRPTAIVFLDLPISVARKRVVSRNRLPLRKMDEENCMEEDLRRLNEYISLIVPPIKVHKINADQSEENVTISIGDVIADYLEGKQYAFSYR